MKSQAATFCQILYEREIFSDDFFVEWMPDGYLLHIRDATASEEMKVLLGKFIEWLQYDYEEESTESTKSSESGETKNTINVVNRKKEWRKKDSQYFEDSNSHFRPRLARMKFK